MVLFSFFIPVGQWPANLVRGCVVINSSFEYGEQFLLHLGYRNHGLIKQ